MSALAEDAASAASFPISLTQQNLWRTHLAQALSVEVVTPEELSRVWRGLESSKREEIWKSWCNPGGEANDSFTTFVGLSRLEKAPFA